VRSATEDLDDARAHIEEVHECGHCPGDADQVLSGVSPGGQQFLIGFEDLASTVGDNDFQDVVIAVRVDTDHLFLIV